MRYRGLFRLFAFLVLLTGLAVGSLAAARAEVSPLASGQESVAPSLAYEADSALRFPGTPVQRLLRAALAADVGPEVGAIP